MTKTIKVAEIIGDTYCIAGEDGVKVFDAIDAAFKAGHRVKLSLENCEFITSCFLNTAIGLLYRDYSRKYIDDNLTVLAWNSVDSAASVERTLGMVKLNSCIFYQGTEEEKIAYAKECFDESLGSEDSPLLNYSSWFN